MEHYYKMLTALAFLVAMAVSITSVSCCADASTDTETACLENVEYIGYNGSEWIECSRTCEILTGSQLVWNDDDENMTPKT